MVETFRKEVEFIKNEKTDQTLGYLVDSIIHKSHLLTREYNIFVDAMGNDSFDREWPAIQEKCHEEVKKVYILLGSNFIFHDTQKEFWQGQKEAL
jgi:hypothetical protein